MKKFIVIEVGSTNTKSVFFNNGKITEFPQITIEFKNNCKKTGKIIESDFRALCDWVLECKKKTNNVFIYGTSIFRELLPEQRVKFLADFKAETGREFNIVTSEQESEYTVAGVVLGNDYNGRLAVMIAGGGSTEVCIVENKKIIERHYNNYGAISVTHAYPQINDLHPALTMSEVDKYCLDITECIKNKADVLVIAGGDFITFYEMAGSEFLKSNQFYNDTHQPYSIPMADSKKVDKRFVLKQDICEYQEKKPEYKTWWLGTRGMRFCVRAVAKRCSAKFIIPTKINMCLGIIKEKTAQN